jgi:hypothetical protein
MPSVEKYLSSTQVAAIGVPRSAGVGWPATNTVFRL